MRERPHSKPQDIPKDTGKSRIVYRPSTNDHGISSESSDDDSAEQLPQSLHKNAKKRARPTKSFSYSLESLNNRNLVEVSNADADDDDQDEDLDRMAESTPRAGSVIGMHGCPDKVMSSASTKAKYAARGKVKAPVIPRSCRMRPLYGRATPKQTQNICVGCLGRRAKELEHEPIIYCDS